MLSINFSQVTRVNGQSLDYLGNDGQPHRIVFSSCAENRLTRLNAPIQDVTNCVGERHVLTKPPYVESKEQPTP